MPEAKTKKRVLIVCQHFWPESFRINDISDFFVEQGCEVDVLCGIPNYPKGKFMEGYSFFRNRRQVHNGASIRRAFEIPRGNNSYPRIFINYLSFPIASLFHIPRLMTKKYDRIFIYQLSPVLMSVAGILYGKLSKTPTTMYVLDLWPQNLFSVLEPKSKAMRTLAAKVSAWHYRNVDKIAVLSQKMRNQLLEVTGFEPDRIEVIPQTSEKIYEQDIPDAALAKKFKGKFNILFAGNISPAQSFETVIDAAKQLRDKGIKDIRWIVVGDGMSREWLQQEVAKAKLTEYFSFEGMKPMEDIPRYTGIADVLMGCLVKSDLLEATIPAKVMSYLAAGKPMVLAMDGEVRDLINNTVKSGFVGPASDADALALNIEKIYAMTPEERAKMGARGRKYHFKHFERNIVLKKLYSFIFG